jgi:nitroimidazol reductase NimA-like FMN-containing flavoprotein (pyridoxamine 5'-phosphate oxidase superfamily)
MATVDITKNLPHIVPTCFVFDGENIYTSLHVRSKRLRNIENKSKTAFLADRYVEENSEWKVLCGLLVYGKTKTLSYHENKDEFMYGWKMLIQKYPQYKHWANADLTPKDPDKRRIIKMQPSKVIRWGFG